MKKLAALLFFLPFFANVFSQTLSLVSPAAGDNWVSGSNQNITWITNGGSIQYVDLYYSTDNGVTYNLIADFTANTGVYAWTLPSAVSSSSCKVAVFNSLNTDVFTESGAFTISGGAGALTITQPNGGEYLTGGSTSNITWTSNGVDNVDIYYSSNNGNSWQYVAQSAASNNSYAWTVPYVNSSTCLVKLVDANDSTKFDVSNAAFNISGDYIWLASPNGGESFTGGSSTNITWSYSGGYSLLGIYYSTNNGATWNTIATQVYKSNLSYNWTVPNINSNNVKIKLVDYYSNQLFDISDQSFTISGTPPSLYLYSPNGGQVYQPNQQVGIQWNSSGINEVQQGTGGGGFGSYLSFDGVDDYINLSYSNFPTAGAARTIEGRFRTTYATNPAQYIFNYGSLTTNGVFGVGTNSNGNLICGTSTTTASGGADLNDGAWHHFAVVFQSNIVRFYIDGNYVSQTTAVYANTTGSTFYIGKSIITTAAYFHGDIDDIRVWNTARSANEIADNYNVQLNGNESGLVAYYNFNEASGQILNDVTFNNPEGTLNNFTGSFWNGTNGSSTTGGVNVYYTSDNGINWNTIETNYNSSDGSNSLYWYTPSTISNNYKIKIESADDNNVFDLSNNTFAVQNPSILVASPNGGETISAGSVYTIAWNNTNVSNYVSLYYSTDGGANYTSIAIGVSNTGNYNWTVPSISSANCKIKVQDYYSSTVFDESDNAFTITAPPASITVYFPNGGENWVTGSSQTISWYSSNISYVNISYSTDGGTTYTSYVNGVNAANGTYSFTVPNIVSNTCRIKVSDYSSSGAEDISDNNLSFVKRTLTVVSPNGGETYNGGTTQYLYIYNNGNTTYGNIDYSTDNGNTWNTLQTAAYLGSGNYSVYWTVPNISSSQCKVRVTDYYDNTIIDVSDATFNINYTSPTISISEPNGGEVWSEGQSYYISWTSYNVSSSNIYYSSDSGSTWNLIVSNHNTNSGNNSYYWTVPSGINSTKCYIKIEDAVNTQYSDKSNGVFAILPPSITVITPNGGDNLQVGSQFRLRWNGVGTSGIYNVEYRTSPTGSWITLLTGHSNTYYDWTVNGAVSSTCKIRVTDYYNSSYTDQSDFNFAIVNNQSASLSFYSPGINEELLTNSTYNISWYTNNVSNVKLEYNLNGNIPTGWVTITNSTASNGSYVWTVPATATQNARLRISDAANSAISAVSDNFKIVQPYITVVSPNSSTQWTAGTQQYIEWDYAGLSNYVNLEYSLDNGSTWNTIINATNNYGYYYWSIPTNISSACFIVRASDTYTSSITDVSQACGEINAAIPTLTLSAPNGGEQYTAGSQQYLYWSYLNVDSIKVEFSSNNGASWTMIDNSVYAADGGMYWNVPVVNSDLCKVRITDKSNATVLDISNYTFKVYQPSIKLIAPNGGESYSPSSVVPVTWTSQAVLSNYVYLYYSVDSGSTWNYITGYSTYDNQMNSYNWTVPNNPSTKCLFKVQEYNNTSYFDISDAKFTITAPQPAITVTYPNGNETIQAGSSTNISYTSQSVSNVNIEYSIDNGANWTTIVSNTQATGSYYWTVPNVSTTNARVRVTDVTNASVTDMSSGNFNIILPMIEVIQPNGGETYTTSTTYPVKYYAEGIINNYIKLYYSLDSGATWTYYNYAYCYNNQINTINWYTPSTPSSKVYVKIEDYYNTSVYDTSNTDFNLGAPQPSITVTAPNGGETWGINNYYYIYWNATSVNNVNIYYSVNNGTSWNTIVTSVTGSSYYWNVPSSLTSAPYNNCLVKIEDASNNNLYDVSNFNFTIANPGISINTPNGGEQYTESNYATIRWTPVAINNYVNLYYSLDSGATYNYITQVYSQNGILNNYSWYISNGLSSEKAKIKICDYSSTSVCDESNAVFTINPSTPYVNLTYPNGGENFTAGQSYNIQWLSNNVSNVKIEYSTDNGSTYNVITSNVSSTSGSTNYYNWTVPVGIGNSCQVKIRITDVSNSTYTDQTAGVFCVGTPTISVTSPNGGETWTGLSSKTITWTSNNISSYVYIALSTDGGNNYGTPIFATNSGSYNYSVPNTSTTQARIQIKDYYNQNILDASDANFTITQAPPSITLTAPNGGGSYVVGEVYPITWSSVSIATIGIEYSTNNGANWTSIADNITASNGSYAWTIPNNPSNQCLVRVYSMTDANLKDESNSTFSIVPPYINVNTPNGGEVWGIGSTRQIYWSSEGVDYVNVYYSVDNGVNWTSILNSYQAGSGYYNWTVPNNPSTQCRIKVEDASDAGRFDISNNTFTIPNPSVTITSPNGGETWASGTQRYIYWNVTGIQTLWLEYSTDGGNNWTTINSSVTASSSYYNWYVPNITSQTCLIRATDVNNSNYTDQSNNYFTIIAPTLNVTSPQGGESYVAYSVQNITWNSNGVSSYVKIEYSVNGGSTWNVISSAEYNDGVYAWTVPNNASTNCKIKITDYYISSISAISEGTFTITEPQPTVTVTTPNGGENWSVGTQYYIRWNSVNISSVKIEFSSDAGNNWTTVIATTPSNNGNNSYLWYVPNTPSSKCLIKITDATNSNVTDNSNAFFTIPTPAITLTSPNGGEVWGSPSQHYIYWNSTSVPNVKIEYTSNGNVWNTIASSVNASNGSYLWNIPSGIVSTNCKVRVTSTLVNSITDQSNAKFTLQQPVVNVISPNGGEVLAAYTTTNITWNGSSMGNYVKIDYSTNNGTSWSNIVNGASNNGSYNWYVPNTPSAQCKVRISDYYNSNITDESNATFTINQAQPSLTLYTPNGGENWLAGSYYYIYWSATAMQNVRLEYSNNNGSTWNTINSSVNASTGYYYWLAPNIVSNQCLVKISDASNASVNDVSNAVFSINQPVPSITVTSPNGGEQWAVNSYRYIYWTSTVVNIVDVYLTTDGGNNYTLVGDNINASQGYLYINVPNTPSTNCMVKIEDVNTGLLDMSDATFEIYEPVANNNTLSTAYTPDGTLCKGDSIYVNYTASGVYNAGNTFSVQLSDTSGNFSNPLEIGYKVSTDLQDSILAVIPQNVLNGNNYRVRVVSTDMPATGSANATSIKVNSPQFDYYADETLKYLPDGLVKFNYVLDSDTTGYTYSWDFGDGNTSDKANPQHDYLAQGFYTINLNVSSAGQCAAEKTFINYIDVEQIFPTIVIPPASNNDLTAVSMANAFIGCAVGNGGTILLTTNGGVNWTPVQANVNGNITSVQMYNVNVAVLATSTGNVYQTLDGGLTWSGITTSASASLNSVVFKDSTTVFVVGDNGTIIKLSGNPTTGYSSSATPALLDVTNCNGVAFSGTTSYCVGSNGSIYKSVQGAWDNPSSLDYVGENVSLNALTFVNSNLGYAVGNNGLVVRYKNNVWEKVFDGISSNFKSVQVKDSLTAYVVGGDGVVYLTEDGGDTWDRYSIGNTTNLRAASYKSGKGVIVGQQGGGFRFGGNDISMSITDSVYCAGQSFSFDYQVSGVFNAGNVFNVQLSDVNGDFSNPQIIGSTTSTTFGNITATIPSDADAGTGYRIRVASTDSVVESADNGFALTVVASPQVSIGNDTSICSGSSITLNAGTGSYTYEWNTGDTTQTISIGYEGGFAVTVTNANGCFGKDSLYVNEIDSLVIDLGADISTCNSSNVELDAGITGVTYSWSTGATTQILPVSTAGTYWVSVSACSQTVTDTIKIDFSQSIATATISVSGGTLTAGGVFGTGVTYQWYYGQTPGAGVLISGATAQSYNPQDSGWYYVMATNAAGCFSYSSSVYASGIGFAEYVADASVLNVYPNPNNGTFNIKLNTKAQNVKIEVVDVLGKVVWSSQINNVNAVVDTQVNLNNQSMGVYMIRVMADDANYMQKVVINR